MFLATGTFRLERGGATDSFGDEVDAAVQIFDSLMGSVVETSRQVFIPSESRSTRISTLMGRFKPGTDLRDGDRLINERTYETFTVTSVERSDDVLHKSDTIVSLVLVETDRT